MGRISYSLLYYLLLPIVFLRLWFRGRKAPLYRQRWGERLGFFAAPARQGGLWLHSVSVGETIAAAPLIKQIQAAYPDLPITITTMTPTGSERVRALFGDSVFHVYVPYDTLGAVRRFLNKVKPGLVLIMETELWPNLIHGCRSRNIDVVIANARLSARSARGYGRFAGLTRNMLEKVSMIAAQASEDGQRFVELGLSQQKLQVTGSVKFDIRIEEPLRQSGQALRQHWGDRPVWVAASTHQGEDERVLEAFRLILSQHSEALLILVPRHPERFPEVAELCQGQGFTLARRSKNEPVKTSTQVLLGDTMGEMMLFFAASDVAFVGGSLVPNGGHNYLEPAALGLPVLSGPHRFNFTQVSELLTAAEGMVIVDDSQALAKQVGEWFEQPQLAHQVGEAAQSVVEANRGAQQRLFELVQRYLNKR